MSTALAMGLGMRTLVFASLLLVGCAHGVANEERLDSDRRQGEVDEALVQGLLRMDCRNAGGELNEARDESVSEGKRQAAYARALIVMQAMVDRYGRELAHNPDLAYSNRAEQLEIAQRRCVDQMTLVKREKARFEAGMGQSSETAVASQAAEEPAPKVVKHASKKQRTAKIRSKTRGRRDVAVAQVD